MAAQYDETAVSAEEIIAAVRKSGYGAERESADIALVRSDLRDAVTAIRLSRAVMQNIRQNLFWAFFYNSIGIPLAAGVFFAWLGLKLNPMFAAAAMSLSSVCVVVNALRLKFFRKGSIFCRAPAKAS